MGGFWLICSVIIFFYETVGVVSSESRQYEENRKSVKLVQFEFFETSCKVLWVGCQSKHLKNVIVGFISDLFILT